MSCEAACVRLLRTRIWPRFPLNAFLREVELEVIPSNDFPRTDLKTVRIK